MGKTYDFDNALESNKYIIPKALKLGKGEKATVVWKIKDLDPSDIVHIKGNCGCTANFKWNSKEIKAVYTDWTKAENIENTSQRFTKTAIVFLKDDKPLKELNEKGVEIFNMDKTHFQISFDVTVIV